MARKSAIELVATPGVAVERVQLAHRLEPEGRGGVAQPQHVGGEIEDHRPHRRVVVGDLGEEAAHQRPEPAGDGAHHSALADDAEAAQPQRHLAHQLRGPGPRAPGPPPGRPSVTWGMVPRKAAVRTEPAMRTKKMPLSTGLRDPSSAPGRQALRPWCTKGSGRGHSRRQR